MRKNNSTRNYIANQREKVSITKLKNGNTFIDYGAAGSLVLRGKEGTFKNAEIVLKRTRSIVKRVMK